MAPESYSSALECLSCSFQHAVTSEQPLWEFFGLFTRHRELFYSSGAELFCPAFTSSPDYLRFLSLLFSRTGEYELSSKACDVLLSIGAYSNEAKHRKIRSSMLHEIEALQDDKASKFASIYKSVILRSDTKSIRNRFFAAIDTLQAQLSKGIDDESRNVNLKRFLELNNWLQSAGSLAIVGSGPKIIGSGKGDEIDAHDRVIRINFAYDYSLIMDIGQRTDLVISSNQHFTGESNMLRSARELSSFTNAPCMLLDCSNLIQEPIPPKIAIDNLLISMPAAIRLLLSEIGYMFSTTGLSSILYIASMMQLKTSLYGFDFYEDFSRPYFHSKMSLEPSILHEIHFERYLGRRALNMLFDNVEHRT